MTTPDMTTEALPGVAADRIDAALRRATGDFATAVATAFEIGAPAVEPSHVLVALAQQPDGLTRSLFAAGGVPVEVFVDALRRGTPAVPGRLPVTELTASTISSDLRKVCDELATGPAPLGERPVLAAVLAHLEPAARTLLEHHGGIDLAAWLHAARTAPLEPAVLFDRGGRLDPDAFSPAARVVLDTLLGEAAALGIPRPGTLVLLHAMATDPHGLLAQAAVHLRWDIRDLRSRLLALLRGERSRGSVPSALDTGTLSEALQLALHRAAAGAAARDVRSIAEQDLFAALLDTPGTPVPAVLRAAEIDPPALLRFATEIYREPEFTEPAPDPLTVTESLDWLREHLIGQDEVVRRLLPRVELIKRAARRRFRIGDRPLATFLFCGPSGTGKTMTARLLAKVVFGSTEDLIVFEMGQYQSRVSINNFIGAPPGYVGFGEGKLTNGLARTPRTVLLFDEVEKAHPLVLHALLRLLDEGRVNDPAGPVRDARDAVVVLTSNVGASGFAALGRHRLGGSSTGRPPRAKITLIEPDPTGEDDLLADEEPADEPTLATRLRRELETFAGPEFLNRIDETILFTPFERPQLAAIAVAGLRRRAAEVRESLGVELTWADDVPGHLVDNAATARADEAARGVNRCVDEVLGLLLRVLDASDDRGEPLTAVRVVVGDAGLAVVRG